MADHGSLFSDPTFYVAIATVLAVLGVYRPASRKAAAALDLHRHSVSKVLGEAHQDLEDSRNFLEKSKKQLENTIRKSDTYLKQAEHTAAQVKTDLLTQFESNAKRREISTNEHIDRLRVEAIAEIKALMADKALSLSGKILIKQYANTKSDTHIDATIKQLTN